MGITVLHGMGQSFDDILKNEIELIMTHIQGQRENNWQIPNGLQDQGECKDLKLEKGERKVGGIGTRQHGEEGF